MGGVYKRKRMHNGHLRLRRRMRLKRKQKDLDEIDTDLKTNGDELLNQEVDLDQAGFGQHYCIHCAKYFIDQKAMEDHFKTKVHRRRMKALELEPYTEKEAEMAAGHGSFTYKPPKRIIETQPSRQEYNEGKRIKVVELTPEELESMTKSSKKNSKKNKETMMQD